MESGAENVFKVEFEQLLDRVQIRVCVYRYSRAIDRCDEALSRSIYWLDAPVEQMAFSVTRDDFVPRAVAGLKAMNATQHIIGNVRIAIEGTSASAESYFQALHSAMVDGVGRDNVMGGRLCRSFREARRRVADRLAPSWWTGIATMPTPRTGASAHSA